MQHDLERNIKIYAYNRLIILTSHDINPINNINNINIKASSFHAASKIWHKSKAVPYKGSTGEAVQNICIDFPGKHQQQSVTFEKLHPKSLQRQ